MEDGWVAAGSVDTRMDMCMSESEMQDGWVGRGAEQRWRVDG